MVSADAAFASSNNIYRQEVFIAPPGLPGILRLPPQPAGIVVFAHGSGSSRSSPRNNAVAEELARAGFATLLFDLLKPEEAENRDNVFDIPLLALRLIAAIDWLKKDERTAPLPVGLFGASTGAAAAIIAAATLGKRIAAVVSRGGRPDLAEPDLYRVTAPTLLIVGGADDVVLSLNRQALARLRCPKQLAVIQGATHLFEEAGAMEAVVRKTSNWFSRYLRAGQGIPAG